MELIRSADVTVLSNSGVQSHQLLFPENSSSSRVTITKVVVAPGSINPPHRHDKFEQVWVAISGLERCCLVMSALFRFKRVTLRVSPKVMCTGSTTQVLFHSCICQ